MEAAIGIAVFTDDTDSYNTAMNIFLKRVPEYVYLQSDGAGPVLPAGKTISNFWNGMTAGNFDADGIAQETCSSLNFFYPFPPFIFRLRLTKIYDTTDTCPSRTGRDLTHTGYGLASIGHVAETARHQ